MSRIRLVLSCLTLAVVLMWPFGIAMAEHVDSQINMDVLRSYGVTDDQVQKLGTDAWVVQSLIEGGKIRRDQVMTLVASLLNPPQLPIDSYPMESGLLVTPGGTIAPPRNTDDEVGILASATGPYWEVTSTSTHFKSTGWAQTPSTGLININSTSNDAGYMFFGCRNTSTGRACDAGIFTDPHLNSSWHMFMFPNDSTKPGNGWVSLQINRPWGSTIYLIFEVITNGAKVTAIDAATWVTLGTLQISVTSDWGFTPTNSNIRVYRVVSIGQKPENLKSGSWFNGAHWYNVYAYKSSGYGLWTSTRTSGTVLYPSGTSNIHLTIPTGCQYYEDYVDIHLNH